MNQLTDINKALNAILLASSTVFSSPHFRTIMCEELKKEDQSLGGYFWANEETPTFESGPRLLIAFGDLVRSSQRAYCLREAHEKAIHLHYHPNTFRSTTQTMVGSPSTKGGCAIKAGGWLIAFAGEGFSPVLCEVFLVLTAHFAGLEKEENLYKEISNLTDSAYLVKLIIEKMEYQGVYS